MRDFQARVVLGAGLCAASAFAQAPASSISLFEQHGASAGASIAADVEAQLDVPDFYGRLYADWSAQGGGDYSVTTLFREAHGEFMDRRERYDPAVELRARWLPNQSIRNEPGDFDLFGYDFDAEFPVVIYPDVFLKFGVYQFGRRYQTSTGFGSSGNTPPVGNFNAEPNWGDETLTAAGVKFGFGFFLSDNVLFEMETRPGAYSDFEGTLTRKDYDYPSSALMTVQATNDLFFKFGARYNQVFEDAPWLPWLGMSWELGSGLRLDLMAPEYVELSWWTSGSTAFSFGAQVQGAQYRVRSTSATGKQQRNLNVQEVFAYVGVTHRMSDYLSLSARAGAVLAGDYDLETGASNFDTTEGALDQGFYVDVTVGVDW
ncbi:MAG: DUF6268 family outer membrane beta-barrel protein [Planctomycetota bacterium]